MQDPGHRNCMLGRADELVNGSHSINRGTSIPPRGEAAYCLYGTFQVPSGRYPESAFCSLTARRKIVLSPAKLDEKLIFIVTFKSVPE